jgi:hypothetical protein
MYVFMVCICMYMCVDVCEVLQFLTFLVHKKIKFSIILIVDSMYVCGYVFMNI